MVHICKSKYRITDAVSTTVLALSSNSHFIFKLKCVDVIVAVESTAYVSAPLDASIYVRALSSCVGIT